MITSASGWRKVFAISGDETDTTSDIGENNNTIAFLAADTFADYILEKKSSPTVILGIDTRPTGPAIAEAMLKVLMARKIAVSYAGIIAAPEIMAFSRTADAFVYISASHNPIGHNGIKFGLNDGGVLCAQENAKLVEGFNRRCHSDEEIERIKNLAEKCELEDLDWVFTESVAVIREAASTYRNFAKMTIAGTDKIAAQNKLFATIRQNVLSNPIGIVADMNGSARTLSIDADFFKECGISFYAINNKPGEIVHAIIPEADNLIWCAAEMEKLHEDGRSEAVLGYMPDCDGDRGNIVFWDEKTEKPVILKAQEVFSLSVLAEVAYQEFTGKKNIAVAVNCPTSMRIEEIAGKFNAKVFRAEVGEANVVNLAAEKRQEGFDVRICGEGSNGGTITYPSAVRDPLNTIFAIIKLLSIKELFEEWCKRSGNDFSENYSLSDVLSTLPAYTTTGVSEKRAVLHIKTKNHSALKAEFQKIFEEQWKTQKCFLEQYGIFGWKCDITNGTKEICGEKDFSKSGKGGLKIRFFGKNLKPLAFIWMRGSGTEPVFRIMCDVKGNAPELEKALLSWETEMLEKADEAAADE